MKLFGEINEEGQTIVMVTHSVKAACSAKRVLFIKDGEVFHQLWIGNQRTRNGCTLLLSAGHLIWVFIEDLGDAEFFRNRLCPKTHLLVFFSFQQERQINIVTQGKGIEQVEVLEHET